MIINNYTLIDTVDPTDLNYFNLGKTLKKIGQTIGDVAQGIAKLTVAPINAVTGHEYDYNTSSKLGAAMEKLGDTAEDAQTGLYGLQTPTETKLGAKIGEIGGSIVKYIPIAGQLHAAVTPLLQKINTNALGLPDTTEVEGTTYTPPAAAAPTLQETISENIVPISVCGALLLLIIIIISSN